MTRDPADRPAVEAPQARLERELIDEYLQQRGYTRADLVHLAAQQANLLLKDASIYAAAKLTEIESRSHFLHEIHGDAERAGKTRQK